MPSPEETNATTVVMEMEPGWIYVKIAEPKPEPDRIEMLLRLTIEQWFNAHPQFVIDKAQAITDHGVMQGIHVWYHVNDRQPEPVSPERPQQVISLAVEVHIQVFRQLPMEHIEAVVDEAIEIWRSHQDGHGTMVVISPRRIAVVLDKQANRGAVVPVELIYPAIEDATKTTSSNLAGGTADSVSRGPDCWKLVRAPPNRNTKEQGRGADLSCAPT